MEEYNTRKYFIPLILLILISIIVFSNTFKNPFVWDEEELIVDNRYTKSLKDIPFLFNPKYWNYYYPGSKGQYRPVSLASFTLDYLIWNLRPFGYHLTNLLLHILNVILIYLIIFRLVRPPEKEGVLLDLPFLAALFFAVHPVHTESIAWIKNRFDLLSLLFLLLSFLFFIKYVSKEKVLRGRIILYFASQISFVLALFSKETAITLPLVLILYAIYFLPKKEYKGALVGIGSYFGIIFFYLAFKLKGLISVLSDESIIKLGIHYHILAVIKTMGYYMKLLILPINLNIEHFLSVPKSFFEIGVVLSSLMLLVLAIMVIRGLKYSRMVSFGILWFFITLLPASNIIFLYARPIAEQRLYIPSLGFCIILAMGIRAIPFLESRFFSRKILKNLAVLFTIAIFIFYSTIAINRNFDWRKPLTLWTKAVSLSPNNARTHNNLGAAYYNIGQYQEAIASYKKAIEIDPKYAMAYNNLGAAYRDIGENEMAIDAFKKAIELMPGYAEAYSNLGVVLYIENGLVDNVFLHLKRAIELKPDYAEAYNNLAGVLYSESGQISQVEILYKRAIELKPDYAEAYYNLGLFYDSSGLQGEALRYYKKAIELDSEYADAYNNIGALYTDLGEKDTAITYLEKTIELAPDHIKAHRNLARIFRDKGLINKARGHWERILEIDPDNEDAKGNLENLQKTED
ncbi:MAG: tetratricopeptide repeat protein [Candidatus Omnitrophica bacterium]|nr:tetratricopeptide repeat protein [Candidatus Omnitrophota bacterium]MBU1852714.1 tetratricopeptide repeat protein [Candidatus Omnitrophota bacterium]